MKVVYTDLNVNAKDFFPTKEKKLVYTDLNVNAKVFKPKSKYFNNKENRLIK